MDKNKKTKESITYLWEILRISVKCMDNNNIGTHVLPVREISDQSRRRTIQLFDRTM